MKSLNLVLLVTQSFALRFSYPINFGGETEFANKGWKELMEKLNPEVKEDKPPSIELNIATEPTCLPAVQFCSTTYFGKVLTLTKPENVQLWVKWHQDTTPFACENPDGCTASSDGSVADLTSQSKGWNVAASINLLGVRDYDSLPASEEAQGHLSFYYHKAPITPKTMKSTEKLLSRCLHNYMCYFQTGTLMMNINGKCDSKPLIVCKRRYFPCEDFYYNDPILCTQWFDFTNKHCHNGMSKSKTEDCTLTVAVNRNNGKPMTYQVFSQKPLTSKRSIARRNYFEPDSRFGELSDGSSGVWMAWGG